MGEFQDRRPDLLDIVARAAKEPKPEYYRYSWEPYALHTTPHPTGHMLKVLKIFSSIFLFQFFYPFVFLIAAGIWYLIISSSKAEVMWIDKYPTSQNLLVVAACFLGSLFITSELAIQIGDRIVNWLQE